MKKALLTLTLIVFIIGCSSVMATEKEQPGPTIKAAEEQQAPEKSKDVLQLEYQVLANQRAALQAQLNQFLTQVEFLKLKMPQLQGQIKEIEAQMRKKLKEIRDLDKPEEVEKPAKKEKQGSSPEPTR